VAYEEIIQQLEFYQSIGIDRIDLRKPVDAPVAAAPVAAVEAIPEVISEPEPEPVIAAAPVFTAETLEDVRADIGDCQRCKLAPTRTHIVYGSGNPHAELVFVGEAPGFDEDQQGLPFVGAAGQLLTKIIESTGIKREDAYICNILKCRPPNNRNPEPDEVFQCSPFLSRQLAAIKPKVVCCLGKFSAQFLLKSQDSITRLRGTFHDVDGMRVIATFHPAYLLRSPEKKREVWDDMKAIRAELFRLRF
jgi:uracil-DNA glycosylase family 4